MQSKRQVSELKQMSIRERKIEGMRRAKAAFELAERSGTLTKRPVVIEC
ncbi:hypothetical protein GPY51_21295 [Photorhabdus laumondii subsp. laumondii]|nr:MULTISPECIES: hypothetical protein [Photorhabdus]MCC8384930.1 hypothetical protein [Photorhabdus laumondii]MCC8413650.1 hypothetical protein [Photorhabdus laumondii]NDK96868.1 hypothetical protein [Photorhabdus laumondii subsp. laumondii]NDL23064.1 hypothetical protein [Photorhabdus laumondii subsp. laumondii]NDL31986.1 hypothetical protein [Photorhabdus laumondii subsp. laumondii]